jgi:hypothetical protein
VTIDTRPPLQFATAGEADDYFRTHGEDIGRPYEIVGRRTTLLRPDQIGKPRRTALGWNAAGVWVWADAAEGQWP